MLLALDSVPQCQQLLVHRCLFQLARISKITGYWVVLGAKNVPKWEICVSRRKFARRAPMRCTFVLTFPTETPGLGLGLGSGFAGASWRYCLGCGPEVELELEIGLELELELDLELKVELELELELEPELALGSNNPTRVRCPLAAGSGADELRLQASLSRSPCLRARSCASAHTQLRLLGVNMG